MNSTASSESKINYLDGIFRVVIAIVFFVNLKKRTTQRFNIIKGNIFPIVALRQWNRQLKILPNISHVKPNRHLPHLWPNVLVVKPIRCLVCKRFQCLRNDIQFIIH